MHHICILGMPVVPIEIDCTPKCRSAAHYQDLIRIASQSIPVQIIINYLCQCGSCGKGDRNDLIDP